MRKFAYIFLPLVVVALLAAACSSSRKAADSSATQARVPAKRSAITSQLAESYKDWTDLYIPLKLELSKPIDFSLSGRATMIRNKSIHLSVRILGLEMAVAHITEDSVWLVNKYDKYVCAAPTSSIFGENKFTLSDIQDVMLGRACYPGKGTLAPTRATEQLFSVNQRNDSTLLLPRKTPKGASWHYILNAVPQLTALNVDLANGAGLSFNYSGIEETIAGAVASQLDVFGLFDKFAVDATLEWNLKKAKWNEGRTDDWTPPGYKRVDIASLIKALKK